MLAPGDVLDNRYEIVERLAEGGMGAVYRARRILLGDEVAIKVISAELAGPGPLERFVRESRACAQLRHPNIVSIFDYNADDPARPFLVMELLSGPSLRDELRERGCFRAADVQRILPGLCSALALAHSRGIVHRDLKPANVVAHDFDAGARVYKLVDFGVAAVRQPSDETRLTGSFEFIGTVSYASPEQLTGGPIDARSDIYSLGAVVFELLTGTAPYDGPDPMSIVSGHLSRPVPSPGSVRPDVPGWMDAVVRRALAKLPEDRWPDMPSFAAALAGSAAEPASISTSLSAGGFPRQLSDTYDVGDRLGPGRLGSTVYRGVHRALGHPVAIRVLRGRGDRADAVRARFLREARTLQINHPSIIQVRDYGEADDVVYVVTDYIDGPSLRQALSEAGALPPDRLGPLAAQLFEAADALHRRRGLLCGLSPEIIRLTRDEAGERLMISSAGVWQAQDLLGTLQEGTLRGMGLADAELRYVAPELLTGRTADVRSDVFTLGVLVYEMATGSAPFDGATLPELLGRMLNGAYRDPCDREPSLAEGAAAAIRRAIAAAPEDRFESVRSFASAFSPNHRASQL